ncbi:MAG: DnaJ domain-containing protein [Labilithrix sp.]|nr:DnaJ domain-containing protein [Labilithrix sp.]
MQLPGRLKVTTLGDLLGALHRSRASGTLELAEPSGRVHRVHVASGLVTAVEVDRACASLAEILRRQDEVDEDTLRRSLLRAMASRRLHGEVLVRDFHLSSEIVGRALRRQIMLRLQVLEDLSDAQISFHVAVRSPRGALVDEPLAAPEFLAGRRRTRDRDRERAQSGTYRAAASGMPGGWDPARAHAYRTLGVSFGAADAEVKQAYRRLVRAYHPDLHPDATHDERKSLSARFAEVTAAYRALVA